MALFCTVPPAAEPVTVSDIKTHLRYDDDGEDALIEGLVRAAREEVEAATGTALIEQDWRLALDAWPPSGLVSIRRRPVRDILSVTTYGADGEAAVMAPQDYTLDAVSHPARVCFAATPPTHRAMNGIEIDFTAGFGEAGADVPDLLKRAVVTLAAHWFEFRAAFGPDSQPVSYPDGYRRMIGPWLDRRLA